MGDYVCETLSGNRVKEAITQTLLFFQIFNGRGTFIDEFDDAAGFEQTFVQKFLAAA